MYNLTKVTEIYADPSVTIAKHEQAPLNARLADVSQKWRSAHLAYRNAVRNLFTYIRDGRLRLGGTGGPTARKALKRRQEVSAITRDRQELRDTIADFELVLGENSEAQPVVSVEVLRQALENDPDRQTAPPAVGAAVYSNGNGAGQQVTILSDTFRIDMEITQRHPQRAIITALHPETVSAMIYNTMELTSLSLTAYRTDAIEATTDGLVDLYTQLTSAIAETHRATSAALEEAL